MQQILKKLMCLLVFLSVSFSIKAQLFEIVGKGNSGEYQCSGYIAWYSDEIRIQLNELLYQSYSIWKREIIDESTIQYEIITIGEDIVFNKYIIIYKCPNADNVYFFNIPDLTNTNRNVSYKTRKVK